MATIYWAGSNQADFTDAGGASPVQAQTSGTLWRSGWQLMAVHCATNNAVADPPAKRLQTGNWSSAVSNFWTHAVFAVSNTGASNNAQWMRWLDASGVCRLIVRLSGTTMGDWKISTRNAAGTITDLVTLTSQTPGTSNPLPVDVQINYGTSGSINFYYNGTSIGSYSGDVTTDGNTTLQALELADGGSNQQTQWSEVVITDVSITGGGLLLLNGSTTSGTLQWSKSGGGIIYSPPNNINTADNISSGTAGNIEAYEMLVGSGYNSSVPTPGSGSWTVMGVVCSAWANQNGSAPQTLEYYFNEGGVGYTFGSYIPQTSYAGSGPAVETNNPSTSAAWQTSDFATTSYWGVESAT